MPRPPRPAAAVAEMPAAVYSPGSARRGGPAACPLNVGDTWLQPFVGGRMEDLHQAEHPGLNRYSATQGVPELVDAIVDKIRSRNRLACERESVLVAAGATGGLCAAVGMLAAPGEEVLILAPFWPLIRGIVQAFRATPVEVPFFDRVDSAEDAVEAVRAKLTPRTVALYVSTPSNPTGRVIPADWLATLAEFAQREDLWLISDEVYEDYVYAGEHVSMAGFAPERTLTTWSFSKAYGMAGFRTGYLVGPAGAIGHAEKISTHTLLRAYRRPDRGAAGVARRWPLGRERPAEYRAVAEATAEMLGLPPPQGSTFHFVNVGRHLDERGVAGFLEDLLDDGVAVAPGASCGSAYAEWVRLCYTAAPPEDVLAAVGRLAARLNR